MNRLIPLVPLAVGIPVWTGSGLIYAAPPGLPHIGFLSPLPESASDREGFRQGLRELGYSEGKNILVDWREYSDAGPELRAQAEALESLREGGRIAGSYVDKILEGAKPSELPIQQISRYELIVDLRLAREMSIDVPRELRARADRAIK